MVSGHEADISEDLPAKKKTKMLTCRGAPSGRGLEAWGDNFFFKVGALRIQVLVSKKYPVEKEGARPGPGAPVLKNAFGVGKPSGVGRPGSYLGPAPSLGPWATIPKVSCMQAFLLYCRLTFYLKLRSGILVMPVAKTLDELGGGVGPWN